MSYPGNNIDPRTKRYDIASNDPITYAEDIVKIVDQKIVNYLRFLQTKKGSITILIPL